MRTFYYFLIGIILFYIDTAIALVIPMQISGNEIIFVPHLTIMYILIMSVYRGFGVAMVFSIVLGLITDLYYGSFYGLYLFGYILLVVIMDFFFKVFYRDHSMLFTIVLLSTLVLEIYVAIIYSALGLVQFNLFEFVIFRMLPTFILIILYPLITKFLKKIQLKIDSKRL